MEFKQLLLPLVIFIFFKLYLVSGRNPLSSYPVLKSSARIGAVRNVTMGWTDTGCESAEIFRECRVSFQVLDN
ncbi:hypothetical protein M758_9G170300 [Ceratodon purpureus]|nr:hypothetical protein M758_9G170300 [Ceratodon purpureus]